MTTASGMRVGLALLAVLLAVAPASAQETCECPGTATYEITVNFKWSSRRHPLDYPAGGFWSPIGGVAHCSEYTVWAPGGTSSSGMKALAEVGDVQALKDTITAECGDNCCPLPFDFACDEMSATCVATATIEMDNTRRYLSWASMFVPSPDWFTGDYNVDLCDNGKWSAGGLRPLHPWDAGTDSGMTCKTVDEPTEPQGVIYRKDGENDEFLSVGRTIVKNRFYNPDIGDVVLAGDWSWKLVA